MAAALKEWHDKSVLVLTGDGRIIVGTLVGHDQVQNLILKEAEERIYSENQDVDRVPLGLYLVRGDNLCLVADYDPDQLTDTLRSATVLQSIQQQQY